MDAMITAVAVGLLGSMDADDTFRVLPLVEDFDAPARRRRPRVRIIHAGADAPAVALDVGNDASNESEAEVPASAFGRFADTGRGRRRPARGREPEHRHLGRRLAA